MLVFVHCRGQRESSQNAITLIWRWLKSSLLWDIKLAACPHSWLDDAAPPRVSPDVPDQHLLLAVLCLRVSVPDVILDPGLLLATNQMLVFRSHDQSGPIRGQCYSPDSAWAHSPPPQSLSTPRPCLPTCSNRWHTCTWSPGTQCVHVTFQHFTTAYIALDHSHLKINDLDFFQNLSTICKW